MKDIENIQDIETVMKKFYSRAMSDDEIGYIFTDVAELDLEEHLPHICKFWQNTLFHSGGYKRNVTQIHQNINDKEPLTQAHFARWTVILEQTVDEYFRGEMANKMKLKAKQVGMSIQAKLGHYS